MSKKKLSLFDLTMIVISLAIGMGIFRTPVVAAAKAGTPVIFFLAWLTWGGWCRGGHESLILPKCASLSPDEFDPANMEHRLLRLYIGLEEPGYLIEDLEQTFIKAS